MYPPIFALAKAAPAVLALLGDPPRLYLFGEAEQATEKPYAVWQTVYGSPENYLSGVPDADRWGVQVDSYASSAGSAREVARALRDAFEPHAYVVAWVGDFKEPGTKLYRYAFTVEFMTPRAS